MSAEDLRNARSFEEEDCAEDYSYPPILTAERFTASAPPERQYLLQHVLPQGVAGLIVGPSGLGKSMFTLQLCMSVACDLPVCDGAFQIGQSGEGAVLYFAAEESVDELHRRIYTCASNMSDETRDANAGQIVTLSRRRLRRRLRNLRIVPMSGSTSHFVADGNTTSAFEYFLNSAREVDNLKLIVFDPLRRFHDGDENDSRTATKLVCVMERFAATTGATVLAVHHTSQDTREKTARSQYASRGSTSFTDGVRFQMNLTKAIDKDLGPASDRPSDCIHVAVTKNNYGPQMPPKLLQRNDGGFLTLREFSEVESMNIEDQIMSLVRRLEQDGTPLGKTEFKQRFAKSHIDAGQARIASSIDRMVEENKLFFVADKSAKGAGRRAQLLSTSCPDAKPLRRQRPTRQK